MKTRSRIAALVAALSLVLSVAGSTLADTSAEQVTILPSQTFAGVPATLVYGGSGVNAGTNADAPTFTVSSGTSDNPNGYKVEASFVTMTKTGDPTKTIATTKHSVKLTGTLQPNSTYTAPFNPSSYASWTASTGVSAGLWSSTQPQATADVVNVALRLETTGVVPGSYTGTATFTFTLK